MSVFSSPLAAVDGTQFRFSYIDFKYFVALQSGALSLVSPSLTYIRTVKKFTVYLANGFIDFPITELEKVQDFLQQVEAAKAAA